MTDNQERASLQEEIVNQVIQLDGSGSSAVGVFARKFLSDTAPEDLAGANPLALAATISSLWKFACERKAGRSLVRVYNPEPEDHPWQAGGTIIEIVNDDMPFLLDSITADLYRRNLTVHVAVHPLVKISVGGSTAEGRTIAADAEQADYSESVIHLRVTEQTSRGVLRQIVAGLRGVLRDVKAAVGDWRNMTRQLTRAEVELTGQGSGLADPDVAEAVEFLKWLGNNNFTFLGHREYSFTRSKGVIETELVAKSSLGILRQESVTVFEGCEGASLPPYAIADSSEMPLIVVNKADTRSTVHRDVQLDVILVRQMDQNGSTIGQHLFVGLFTSVVYRQSVRSIPIVRRKLRKLVSSAGLTSDSYDGRALSHVLEALPRNEVFQMESEELQTMAMEILRLQRRRGTDMFTRQDPFGRYVSCLVYLPRDRFDSSLRQRIERVLISGFGGPLTTGSVQISDDVLARLHYLVSTDPEKALPRGIEAITNDVIEACRSWVDDLAIELVAAHGEKIGTEFVDRYRRAFPESWRTRFDAADTVADIEKLERVLESGETEVELDATGNDADNAVRFKIFVSEDALALSDVLPILENMGFRIINEIPHRITTSDGRTAWVHDFTMLSRQQAGAGEIHGVKPAFEQAFLHVLGGDVEDDGFNALIVSGGLEWRQVVILRALCSYLHQTGVPFGSDYMAATLTRNGRIAHDLAVLFEARFSPDAAAAAGSESSEAELLHKGILEALNSVENPDEDRLLRRLLNLIDSTLRTNYFVPDGAGNPKSYLSFKIDSTAVADLPLPRPAREIFVYSPRIEGIHCRGGLVARGGLRWSDRRADFRTEILGLMKAQMTKNAVIVPEGSKGGFVVKQPPAGGREALIEEGIACYKSFIQGLLDVTDNLKSGEVIPPSNVVRRDGDDPYLVVAADKGTATFSDIANGISAEYGFWLGDAFASGGSAGYDHKKMGITARGAWECVKRHFREIGTDIQNEDFTVVGIGDMSGDVFGNGMLLSRHIRLLGAFNHLHIFVDPDPDAAVSWKERERLFRLPRSSWSDYHPDLISPGGGVYSRNAKEVPLSAEARKAFDLPEKGVLTPNEVIRAMLRSRVDLIWFGGIGTYVKAARESHESVGDRNNDSVRVDGRELRCKIVGEGANLGVTQLGRVAFAQRGGRINADFIDNSAGVASSDQEVNIKILMGEVMSSGKLSLRRRNQYLEEMTDDVAEHCLMDNYRQGLALTLAEARAPATLAEHKRFIRRLELAGDLDRAVEYLPNDEELLDRATRGQGLTRPELAVLLAYAKNTFYKNLLASDVPDDPWLIANVGYYFPPMLREHYRSLMPGHRLQREITATYVSNSLINRAGPTFVETIAAEKGCSPDKIARAYLVCREVFGLPAIWQGIEDLDNLVSAEVQTNLHLLVLRHISRATVWFAVKLEDDLDMAKTIKAYGPGMDALTKLLQRVAPVAMRNKAAGSAARFAGLGVPENLAESVVNLDLLFPGCEIVRLSAETDMPIGDIAEAYFGIGEWFSLDELHETAASIVPENEWQSAALSASVDELRECQVDLTAKLIRTAGSASAVHFELGKWEHEKSWHVDGLRQVVTEIRGAEHPEPSMLPVAAHKVRALCEI